MKSKSENVHVSLCNAIFRSNPLFSDLCLQQERHHNDDSFTTLVSFFLQTSIELRPMYEWVRLTAREFNAPLIQLQQIPAPKKIGNILEKILGLKINQN